MNKNTNKINLPPARVEKIIGGTTYIVTASFNGDEKRDMVKAHDHARGSGGRNRQDARLPRRGDTRQARAAQ